MKVIKSKLAETNPDRVAAFEKGAAEYAKKIVANFKDYEFVSGWIEGSNPWLLNFGSHIHVERRQQTHVLVDWPHDRSEFGEFEREP